MAKTAKEYAQELLGGLDLSYLDTNKKVAGETYKTSSDALTTNYEDFKKGLEADRTTTRKNFNTGKRVISENAFDRNAAANSDLASRVTGVTGLKGLNETGNRIAMGQEFSDIGNTYHDTLNEIANTETSGKNQYTINQQELLNSLNKTNADIEAAAGSARNNYASTLATLAEQVQGNWDSNKNAKEALALQARIAAQARADAQRAASDNLRDYKRQALTDIVTAKDAKGNPVGTSTMINNIMITFGVDYKTANSVLQQLGKTTANYNTVGPTKSYYELLGIGG